MIKSMTAYGRASKEIEGVHWVVEIHSINQKGLNINLYVPKEFLCFDIDMRKWIGEGISRGQITVRITSKGNSSCRIDIENLKDLKKRWEEVASSLGYSPNEVDLPFLTAQIQSEMVLNLVKDETKMRKELKTLFSEALQDLMKMKLCEGENLLNEMEERMKKIELEVQGIGTKAKDAPVKYKGKLEERLKTLLQGHQLEEGRMIQEVALFAEKVDITEEIERMHSHLGQLFTLFRGKEKSVGRTVDFLIQEMMREVNTMGSKSDLEIGIVCIGIRSELEKIKEQVQNVE